MVKKCIWETHNRTYTGPLAAQMSGKVPGTEPLAAQMSGEASGTEPVNMT
jgi:hypothetical protein